MRRWVQRKPECSQNLGWRFLCEEGDGSLWGPRVFCVCAGLKCSIAWENVEMFCFCGILTSWSGRSLVMADIPCAGNLFWGKVSCSVGTVLTITVLFFIVNGPQLQCFLENITSRSLWHNFAACGQLFGGVCYLTPTCCVEGCEKVMFDSGPYCACCLLLFSKNIPIFICLKAMQQ